MAMTPTREALAAVLDEMDANQGHCSLETYDAARAALAQPEPGTVKVTAWKIRRAAQILDRDGDAHGIAADLWSMLADQAAPTPPAQPETDPDGVVYTQIGGVIYTTLDGKTVRSAVSPDSLSAMLFRPLPVGTLLYAAAPPAPAQPNLAPEKRLLLNLREAQQKVEKLILEIPTGPVREKVCDSNINLMSAIALLEGFA